MVCCGIGIACLVEVDEEVAEQEGGDGEVEDLGGQVGVLLGEFLLSGVPPVEEVFG